MIDDAQLDKFEQYLSPNATPADLEGADETDRWAREMALALIAEVRRLRGEAHTHYTSTYCIHDQHGFCRLVCKICESRCLCECHK